MKVLKPRFQASHKLFVRSGLQELRERRSASALETAAGCVDTGAESPHVIVVSVSLNQAKFLDFALGTLAQVEQTPRKCSDAVTEQ